MTVRHARQRPADLGDAEMRVHTPRKKGFIRLNQEFFGEIAAEYCHKIDQIENARDQ